MSAVEHVTAGADGWTVRVPYGDLDLLYGPYRTEADAVAVWQRLAAQFRREGQGRAIVSDAPVAHAQPRSAVIPLFPDWEDR